MAMTTIDPLSEDAKVCDMTDSPPTRHITLPAGHWSNLLGFLHARFPAVSKGIWEQRIANGQLWFSDGAVVLDNLAYRPHAVLFYRLEATPEPPVPFAPSVVYENDYIVIADKPHFLPVAPVGPFVHNTLQSRLRHLLGISTLQAAHRLDRETAGLVLLVKQPEHRDAYQALFAQRCIQKDYLATSQSPGDHLQFPLHHTSRLGASGVFFLQTQVPGEPNATTIIQRLHTLQNGRTLYHLEPLTGRKHQLRVHMNACGCPLVGDRFYPQPTPPNLYDFTQPLQLLASAIDFKDSMTGDPIRVETTLRLEGT